MGNIIHGTFIDNCQFTTNSQVTEDYLSDSLLPSVHQFAIAPSREQRRMTTWPQSCRLCFSWMTIVRLLSIVVSSGRQLVNSWQIFTLVWSWFSHFWRPGRGPGWDCWRSPTHCAGSSREAAPARDSASFETWPYTRGFKHWMKDAKSLHYNIYSSLPIWLLRVTESMPKVNIHGQSVTIYLHF